MATLTATMVESTPYHLTYLLVQEGGQAPDTTLTILNSVLVADALPGSPLGNMLNLAAGTAAVARSYLFSDGAPSSGGEVAGAFSSPRAHTWISSRTGDTTWIIDAASSSGHMDLALEGPAAASSAYLFIEFSHTIDA